MPLSSNTMYLFIWYPNDSQPCLALGLPSCILLSHKGQRSYAYLISSMDAVLYISRAVKESLLMSDRVEGDQQKQLEQI